MKPVDIRNENWEGLRERVAGLRLIVWQALRQHGPCTTRALAAAAGIDILTVRPRVTELVQLGFADLLEERGGEGVYAAVREETARQRFEGRKGLATRQTQLALPLT